MGSDQKWERYSDTLQTGTGLDFEGGLHGASTASGFDVGTGRGVAAQFFVSLTEAAAAGAGTATDLDVAAFIESDVYGPNPDTTKPGRVRTGVHRTPVCTFSVDCSATEAFDGVDDMTGQANSRFGHTISNLVEDASYTAKCLADGGGMAVSHDSPDDGNGQATLFIPDLFDGDRIVFEIVKGGTADSAIAGQSAMVKRTY